MYNYLKILPLMHLAKILRRKIAFMQHNILILLNFIFPSGKHGFEDNNRLTESRNGGASLSTQ
jgi:hypothetical protein